MPNPGLAMLAIKEILRLKYEARLSQRQIARSLQLSVGVVSKYLRRAQTQQISWPLPAAWSDVELLARLGGAGKSATRSAPLPDFALLHQELQRKGVTRLLLWREYKTQQADGMGYTKFTRDYKTWKAQRGLTMRQIHKAGEAAQAREVLV